MGESISDFHLLPSNYYNAPTRELSFPIVQGIICLPDCLRQIFIHFFRAVNLCDVTSTNYINCATPTMASWAQRLLAYLTVVLMICKVGKMKCAARISFCANRAKVHIMRQQWTNEPLAALIQLWLTKFHSFFLHFSISLLFLPAICGSCCDKSKRSQRKFSPLLMSAHKCPK